MPSAGQVRRWSISGPVFGGAPVGANNGGRGVLPGHVDADGEGADCDGVPDGADIGLNSPWRDTDLTKFAPDKDPSTQTNPTKKDTDGDGLPDGRVDFG